MESVLVGLGAVNVVLVIVAIVLLVRVRSDPGGGASTEEIRSEMRAIGQEIRQDLAGQRRELNDLVSRGQQDLAARVDAAATAQSHQLNQERESRLTSDREFRSEVDKRLAQLRGDNDAKLEQIRLTVDENLRGTLTESLKGNADKVQELIEGNARKHVEIQKLLSDELDKLRTSNEAKLETMRA
ncbi:MAG: hypothetical protein L0J79_06640, partial [Propionibacterium sp.]|nr:hypothetical protein [Propionibacterium sp.]